MTNNFKIASLMLSAAALSGCFYQVATPKGKAFDTNVDLRKLEGCYENESREPVAGYSRPLASYMFSRKDIGDNKVDFIRVVSQGSNVLNVSAESTSGVIAQKTFMVGRDFHFEAGRVRIELDTSQPNKPGNVFLGFTHGSEYLGIDQHGDGLSEDIAVVAGTGFLVIPITAYQKVGYSYNRRPDLCAAAKSK